MSNIETVKELYARSATGDIASILRCLSRDIEWDDVEPSTDVPWLQPRRGHDAVARFFEALGLLELHVFAPKHFVESGDLVVVLVDEDVTVKATGKRVIDQDQVHLWYFDTRGQVVRFRQRLDTHAHWMAFHGNTL
jgi:uncharacterized protein